DLPVAVVVDAVRDLGGARVHGDAGAGVVVAVAVEALRVPVPVEIVVLGGRVAVVVEAVVQLLGLAGVHGAVGVDAVGPVEDVAGRGLAGAERRGGVGVAVPVLVDVGVDHHRALGQRQAVLVDVVVV